ncbi:MAG: hypothetical protein AAGD01_10005 [Acidobacteriota bacterium]
MSERIQDLLTAAFVLAGIVWLAMAGANRLQRAPLPAVDYPESTAVDVDRLLSPASFQFEGSSPSLEGAPVLALFVLHAQVCPPCLHGVEEYTHLLQELEPELDGQRIEALALVFEEDPEQARRFLGTSALPLPGAFGYPEDLAKILGHFSSDNKQAQEEAQEEPQEEVLQQMVFVDTATGTLFYRALLPNAVTPPEHKKEVLGRVAQAHHELRS